MTTEMQSRMSMTALALLAIVGAPVMAFAQTVLPVCSDDSRACLIGTANRYIDGLSHHNASAIPFAPAVRCTEQGEIPVTDAAKFRAEIESSTAITGVRNLRLMADPQARSVVAFYMLDVAAYGGKPAYTVRRGQRFRMDHGLIDQVEIINYVDPKLAGLAPPLWPDSDVSPAISAQDAQPLCTAATRACDMLTAKAYFDAVSKTAGAVAPFAADLRVTEQGQVLATSRSDFLSVLAKAAAPAAWRNMRFLVDETEGEVAVLALADVHNAGEPPYTVRRIQRMRIVHGQIHEVELVIYEDQNPGALWPDQS
jgi:hypothetical protein